jgi:hypothetical protein
VTDGRRGEGDPNPELAKLRARFMTLLAFEGMAGVLAVALVIGYFGFHVSWCLPLFAIVLIAAVAAQIWFIAAFGRSGPKGA